MAVAQWWTNVSTLRILCEACASPHQIPALPVSQNSVCSLNKINIEREKRFRFVDFINYTGPDNKLLSDQHNIARSNGAWMQCIIHSPELTLNVLNLLNNFWVFFSLSSRSLIAAARQCMYVWVCCGCCWSINRREAFSSCPFPQIRPMLSLAMLLLLLQWLNLNYFIEVTVLNLPCVFFKIYFFFLLISLDETCVF